MVLAGMISSFVGQGYSSKNAAILGTYIHGSCGDVIAEKKDLSIKWGFLTEGSVKLIKNTLVAGYFPFSFHDCGVDITIESYRGTLSKEHLGDIGDGEYWYKSVSVDIIQR